MEPLDYWRQMGLGMAVLNLLPFGGLLVLIAVLPFIPATAAWWEKTQNKLFLCVGSAILGVFLGLGPTHDFSEASHVALDYAAFIALLSALYIAGGGIHISGAYQGFPFVNTLFLLIGALLSNVLGTTGASMLLIRPLLNANQHRKHKAHILLFFIFIVSNCASCLIPLGPPLYLGYLRGVPLLWTFHLFGPCALTVGLLLVGFHFYDERVFEGEEVETKGKMAGEIARASKGIHIQGWVNVVFLLSAIGAVLYSGYGLSPVLTRTWGPERSEVACKLFQIGSLVLLAWLSYRLTPKEIHYQNRFHAAPMVEVAILIFGIFGVMIPALCLMQAKASLIGLREPWQYFWATGLLSAFLDNAPTYLNAAVLAAGQHGISSDHLGELASRFPGLLCAVSCGASFMGALTYIGNGPNLMVKAIAEHHHVRMPSFGGYLLWSGCILIPIFILITFIFF